MPANPNPWRQRSGGGSVCLLRVEFEILEAFFETNYFVAADDGAGERGFHVWTVRKKYRSASSGGSGQGRRAGRKDTKRLRILGPGEGNWRCSGQGF
jgi:hypothetical protein